MKKLILVMVSSIFLLLILCIASCKKDKASSHIGFSIKLSDKPLDTIKKYIQGKWKFEYSFGGIANTNYYPPNGYIGYSLFTANNRVYATSNGIVDADATIKWIRVRGVTQGDEDSTYTMSYYNKQNLPWGFVIVGISNDTLIYHDYSSDAMFYHLSKSN